MQANLDQLTCPGCGYALRGLPDNVCPECGREFDAEAMLADLRRTSPSVETARLCTFVAALLACVSVIGTPFFGLILIDEIASQFGAHCGTHFRSDAPKINLFGVIALGVAWSNLWMAASARTCARPAWLAALATTTAWITMWVLVGSV
jgi:hypothetical protein